MNIFKFKEKYSEACTKVYTLVSAYIYLIEPHIFGLRIAFSQL